MRTLKSLRGQTGGQHKVLATPPLPPARLSTSLSSTESCSGGVCGWAVRWLDYIEGEKALQSVTQITFIPTMSYQPESVKVKDSHPTHPSEPQQTKG